MIESGSGKFDQRTVAEDDVILSTVIFQENIGLAVKSEYTFIKKMAESESNRTYDNDPVDLAQKEE